MRILNTYFPGIPAQINAHAQVCAVLTEDESGHQAVYLGIVKKCNNEGERDAAGMWVATMGTKMRWRDSLMFFPQIKESTYRA